MKASILELLSLEVIATALSLVIAVILSERHLWSATCEVHVKSKSIWALVSQMDSSSQNMPSCSLIS